MAFLLAAVKTMNSTSAESITICAMATAAKSVMAKDAIPADFKVISEIAESFITMVSQHFPALVA